MNLVLRIVLEKLIHPEFFIELSNIFFREIDDKNKALVNSTSVGTLGLVCYDLLEQTIKIACIQHLFMFHYIDYEKVGKRQAN